MRSLEGSELLRFQPNRYPFLMIDKVIDFVPGTYARGYKNFTNNEWFFPSHFPAKPNVPGVLQIEAMVQMMTIALTTLEGLEGSITRALRYEGDFKREVRPGDRLDISTEIESWKRGICRGAAVCTVEGELVSRGRMLVTIPEIISSLSPSPTSSNSL